MMKKTAVLMAFLLLFTFTGCSAQVKKEEPKTDISSKVKTERQNNVVNTPQTDMDISKESKTVLNEKGAVPIQYSIDSDGNEIVLYQSEQNKIVLYNLSKKKELYACDMNNENIAITYSNLLYVDDDCYILYIDSRQMKKEETDEEVGLEMSTSTGEDENEMIYVLNRDLSVLDKYNLKEIFPEYDTCAETGMCVSPSGSELIMTGYESIYFYEFDSGKTTKISNEIMKQINNICIKEMVTSSDGKKIAFLASENNEDTYEVYGIIDLEKKKVIQKRTQGGTVGCKLHMTNDIVYITDSEAVYTNKASGIIICMDFTDNSVYDFQVDNRESTIARLSDDKKYMITANDILQDEEITGYHFRVYDFNSGEALREKTLKFQEQSMRLDDIEYINGKVVFILWKEDDTYEFYSYHI